MKLKGNRYVIPVLILAAVVLAAGLLAGCTQGAVSIGWSGGTVSSGYLYIGSNAGRLDSINLSDDSILRAEVIKAQATTSLLSCGCGGGTPAVPIYGTPLVIDNTVFIAGYNGRIYSYRADNLAQRWIYPANGYLKSFVGGLVNFNGILYIGCSDGNVYAVNAETGNLVMKYKTGGKIWATGAIDPLTKTLFIGSYDKKLYALDLDTLSLKWTYSTKGSIICTPLVDNGTVYFGSFDRAFYALDAATGNLKWQFRGNNWFWAQPLINNGVLYAPCLDHKVYILDPMTGKETHEAYNLLSGIASPAVVVENLVIFVSQKGVLYKLDTATMKIETVIDLKIKVDGPILAHDGIVYIHPQEPSLIRINPVTGSELPTIEL